MDDSYLLWRTLGLGAISGMRSMAAPAILSRAVERGDLDGLENTPFAAFGSPRVSTVLRMFEIGEMLVDKLPVMVPSRTSPPPLLGRAVTGAVAGAALFASGGRRIATGGVLGGASAVAGRLRDAAAHVRGRVAERLGVPDPIVALLEDGLVLFGGASLLR